MRLGAAALVLGLAHVADGTSYFTVDEVNGWWDTTWDYDGCNVQGSDFGIATVTFDSKKYNSVKDKDEDKTNPKKDSVATNIQRGSKFHGLSCEWKYDGATSGASWEKFGDKDKLKAFEKDFTQEFALKLRNLATTTLTATCTLYFKHDNGQNSDLVPYCVPGKTFTLRNCDFPRLESKELTDQGRFIKGTCEDSSWLATAGRKPAPFQACAGMLVFPSAGEKEKQAFDTVLMDTTKSTELECCTNGKLTFECSNVQGSSTVKRCTEVPKPATALTAFSLAVSNPTLAASVGGAVAVVVVAVAVVAAKKARHGASIEDGYAPLLH